MRIQGPDTTVVYEEKKERSSEVVWARIPTRINPIITPPHTFHFRIIIMLKRITSCAMYKALRKSIVIKQYKSAYPAGVLWWLLWRTDVVIKTRREYIQKSNRREVIPTTPSRPELHENSMVNAHFLQPERVFLEFGDRKRQ